MTFKWVLWIILAERCKKKSCLSLSIFTLGLNWVRTKEEGKRAPCQERLGSATVLLLLLGEESTISGPTKHYISYLIFDGTTVQKKTSWPGREKYKCLSKKSLQQWRPAPKGKVQCFCWIGFSFWAQNHTPETLSSMFPRVHISSVLCYACPTLIASSSDRCGHYFWRALRPIKPALDSPYDTQVIGSWPSQWQISPSNYFRRMDVILCLTDYVSPQQKNSRAEAAALQKGTLLEPANRPSLLRKATGTQNWQRDSAGRGRRKKRTHLKLLL